MGWLIRIAYLIPSREKTMFFIPDVYIPVPQSTQLPI
jgi:hypothetical protein